MDREERLEVLEVENEDVEDDDRSDGKLEVGEPAYSPIPLKVPIRAASL